MPRLPLPRAQILSVPDHLVPDPSAQEARALAQALLTRIQTDPDLGYCAPAAEATAAAPGPGARPAAASQAALVRWNPALSSLGPGSSQTRADGAHAAAAVEAWGAAAAAVAAGAPRRFAVGDRVKADPGEKDSNGEGEEDEEEEEAEEAEEEEDVWGRGGDGPEADADVESLWGVGYASWATFLSRLRPGAEETHADIVLSACEADPRMARRLLGERGMWTTEPALSAQVRVRPRLRSDQIRSDQIR